MNKKKPLQKHLDVLRVVHNNPNSSQRDLAESLGISLGKFNYLLKAMTNRGLIKIQNFSKSKKKINYIYVLTPKGIKQKLSLTLRYMEIKMKEYDELKKEVNNVDSRKS